MLPLTIVTYGGKIGEATRAFDGIVLGRPSELPRWGKRSLAEVSAFFVS